jgi:hypothetical protein
VPARRSEDDPQKAKYMRWALCLVAFAVLAIVALLWKVLSVPSTEPVTAAHQAHAFGNAFSKGTVDLEQRAMGKSSYQRRWDVIKGYPNVSQIQSVDFNESDLSDDDWHRLAQMTNLRQLELESSSFSDQDMKYLQQLPLQYLGLSRTSVTDSGLRALSKMTSLKILDLSDTHGVTDLGLQELPANIVRLTLSGDQFTDAGLQHLLRLKALRVLVINGCHQIGPDSVNSLAAMRKLEFLDMRNTAKLSSEDLGKIKAALPNCFIRSDDKDMENYLWQHRKDYR